MWKETVTASALAIALAAMPAVAQQTPGAQPESPAASETPKSQDDNVPSMTDMPAAQAQDDQSAALKGLPVYGTDGQKIGEVAEAKMDGTGRAEAIHVDVGTFLGLGSKTVVIEADQFTQTDDRINLSISSAEAKTLPEAPRAQ